MYQCHVFSRNRSSSVPNHAVAFWNYRTDRVTACGRITSQATHFKYNITNDYSDYNTLTITEKDDCRAVSHFLKSTI